MSIQRYAFIILGAVPPDPNGDWVKFEAHKAELAASQEALALYVDSYKRVEAERDALALRLAKRDGPSPAPN